MALCNLVSDLSELIADISKLEIHLDPMGDTWLSNTTNEKDLGIVVDHKLNMSQECDAAAKRQMLFWAALVEV